MTISGTALPTTIAASPYQKQETIKNSDINYQQKYNLENLNRTKRGSAGTGFAQGMASVLEQFKPAQQTDHNKYTSGGYVVFPEKQYKDYKNKVNELYAQGKIKYHY